MNHDELWLADLAMAMDQIEYYWGQLSVEETRSMIQPQSIATRALLRLLLAHYLEEEPRKLKFNYSAHGKPSLVDYPLHFNLSHSKRFAMVAISPHGPIGVDIEYQRPIDSLAIANRFFSPEEYQALIAQPVADQQRYFYQLWTSKEAFVKAIDQGISVCPFKSFTIANNAVISTNLQYLAPLTQHWKIISSDAIPSYTYSIALPISPPLSGSISALSHVRSRCQAMSGVCRPLPSDVLIAIH